MIHANSEYQKILQTLEDMRNQGYTILNPEFVDMCKKRDQLKKSIESSTPTKVTRTFMED
jgi:hypothetical protein